MESGVAFTSTRGCKCFADVFLKGAAIFYFVISKLMLLSIENYKFCQADTVLFIGLKRTLTIIRQTLNIYDKNYIFR